MADSEDIGTVGVEKPPEVKKEEKAVARRELKEAIKGSHELLANATTVFPFTFFPDTVAVDRTKLTITRRKFFGVADVMSIRIEDILNVTAHIGPLFGSLHITSRVLTADKPYEVKYLWRDDTLKLKRVMQGYIIAMQREIDVRPLKTEELAKLLNDLGKDDHT